MALTAGVLPAIVEAQTTSANPTVGNTFFWRQLSDVPDPRGVAAVFAGVHRGGLLAGGGANFPDRLPWEGGTKVWYDRVWRLDTSASQWRSVGRLPRPVAYGVSITTAEGVVCIGGSDSQRHWADVFRLSWTDERLEITDLPPLPQPVANACGALVGSRIYVAGGLAEPLATSTLPTFFELDLSAPQLAWRSLPTWPGPPRMLSVAATIDDSFFLLSGTDLTANADGKSVRRYLSDAYRYRPSEGWRRVAEMPRPVVAAPSPAPNLAHHTFVVIGGDAGTHVGFEPPTEHPGFSADLLEYDSNHDLWRSIGQTPAARVTVPLVRWGLQWLIVSGEQRPGVRSPEVWSFTRPGPQGEQR